MQQHKEKVNGYTHEDVNGVTMSNLMNKVMVDLSDHNLNTSSWFEEDRISGNFTTWNQFLGLESHRPDQLSQANTEFQSNVEQPDCCLSCYCKQYNKCAGIFHLTWNIVSDLCCCPRQSYPLCLIPRWKYAILRLRLKCAIAGQIFGANKVHE